MAEHIPYRLGEVVYVDDPKEGARIDRLQKAAERDIARAARGESSRKPAAKKRPPTRGDVSFRMKPAEQARLQEIADAEGISPNLAAKRIVLRELEAATGTRGFPK